MTVSVFIWLLVVLTLSLTLLQLRHRQKVEARIKAGTSDARGILDSSTEGIISTNSACIIIRFNLAAEDIFAYKAHNVIGKNVQLLLAKDTRKTHENIMSGAGSKPRDRATHTYELMARRSDGTEFPLALTVTPTMEKGKPSYLGMLRDISARKQAEVTSRKNQQMMEFLLQSSPVIFYVCNIKESFSITYISANVEKYFGHTPETITSAAAFWPRHIHPDDQGRIHSGRLQDLKDGNEEIEYRLKLADGSYRWITDNRTLINDQGGKPDFLIGCWTDIHDRKKTEIKLSAQQERLAVSLKCANLTTWDWDINSGEITWFGNIEKMLGLDQKQVTSFDDFIAIAHAEDQEAIRETIKSCLVQDKAMDHECRVVWSDKSIHWIHLIGELINDETGGPVRMAGVLSDITARKRLQIAPSPAIKRAS